MPNSMPSAFSIRLDIGAAPKKKDRKSTRLNSSHSQISYAVFCLKKKKNDRQVLAIADEMMDRGRVGGVGPLAWDGYEVAAGGIVLGFDFFVAHEVLPGERSY